MATSKSKGKKQNEKNKKVEKNETVTISKGSNEDENVYSKSTIDKRETVENNKIQYTARGLPENGHGTAFELRVVMLSCMNAYRNCQQNRQLPETGIAKYEYDEFYLAPGLMDAGAFDDVAFICGNRGTNNWKCVLIQAKHGRKGEIDLKELQKCDNSCNFGIRKYFNSYIEVKNAIKNKRFASNLLRNNRIDNIFIDSLVICSNLPFTDNLDMKWFDTCNVNFLLNMNQVYPKAYKFKYEYYRTKNSRAKDVVREFMGNTSEIDEDELREFLDCLIFAVDFPKIDKIDTVVSNEFNTQLSQQSMKNQLATCFQGWLMDRIIAEACYITNEELRDFLTTCNSPFTELYLAGVMSEFKLDIELYNFQTEKNSIFRNFVKSNGRYIYCATPPKQNLRLTTVQVYSLLSSIVNNKSKIFVISQKMVENMKDLTVSDGTYIIIECEEDATDFAKIREVMKETHAKTVIVVTSNVRLDNLFEKCTIPPVQYINLPDLQEKEIVFQGKNVLLKDFISCVPERDQPTLFSHKVLYELLKPSKTKLGTVHTNTGNDIYIERFFEYSCELDMDKLLHENNKEFFRSSLLIIENMKKMPDETHLLRKYISAFSSVTKEDEAQQKQDIRLVFFDDTTDRTWGSNYTYEKTAKDVRQRFKRDYVHFVELSENETQKKPQCLLRYSSRLEKKLSSSSVHISKSTETYRAERLMLHDFIDSENPMQTLENKFALKNQITLLHAGPGVGKTTFVMNSISKLSVGNTDHVSENSNFIWRIYINLRNYKTYINEHEFKDLKDVVEFLSVVESHNEDSKLFTEPFLECFLNYSSERFKTLLVLDGYDEIDQSLQEKILKMTFLITGEERMKFVYILITSRSYVARSLENRLGYYAYKLRDFSEEDQQNYIEKLWLDEDSFLSPETKRESSKKLVQKLNFSKTEQNLLGTPLLCYIAAKTFAKAVPSDDDNCLEKKINVSNYYDDFVIYKYSVYREKQKIQESIFDRWFLDKCNELHRYLSLTFLFPNMFQDWYGSLDRLIKDTSDYDIMNGIGIVEITRDKNLPEIRFLHQTFAEYYVAQLFLHVLVQDREERVLSACQLFIQNKIFKKANTSIDFFLREQLESVKDKTLHERWDFIQSNWLVKPNTQPSLLPINDKVTSLNEYKALEKKFDLLIQGKLMAEVLIDSPRLLNEYHIICPYVIEKLKGKCSELDWTNVKQCKDVLCTIGNVYISSQTNKLLYYIHSALLECTNSIMAQLMCESRSIRQRCLKIVMEYILKRLQNKTPVPNVVISLNNEFGSIDISTTIDYSHQLVELLKSWLLTYLKINEQNITNSVEYWGDEQRNQLKTTFGWLFSYAFPQLFMKLNYGAYRWRHYCILIDDYQLNDRLVDLLIVVKTDDDKLKSLWKKRKELSGDYFNRKYKLDDVKLQYKNIPYFLIIRSIMAGSEKNKEKLLQQFSDILKNVKLSEIESEGNRLRGRLINDLLERKLLDNQINDIAWKRDLYQTQLVDHYFSRILTGTPEEEFESLRKMLTDFSQKLREAVESWFIKHYQSQNFESQQDRYKVNNSSEALLYGFIVIKNLRFLTMPMARQLITFLETPEFISSLSDIDISDDILKPLISILSENHEDYIDRNALVSSLAHIYAFLPKLSPPRSAAKHAISTGFSKEEITIIVQLVQTVFKSFENSDFSSESLLDTVLLLLSLADAHGFVLINDKANYRLILAHPNDTYNGTLLTFSEKFHEAILNHISKLRPNIEI